MNKLVLIFNEGDEVVGIDNCLVFHNEVDAIEFLQSKKLENVKLEIDIKWFYFKTFAGWSGSGKVFWAKQY